MKGAFHTECVTWPTAVHFWWLRIVIVFLALIFSGSKIDLKLCMHWWSKELHFGQDSLPNQPRWNLFRTCTSYGNSFWSGHTLGLKIITECEKMKRRSNEDKSIVIGSYLQLEDLSVYQRLVRCRRRQRSHRRSSSDRAHHKRK